MPAAPQAPLPHANPPARKRTSWAAVALVALALLALALAFRASHRQLQIEGPSGLSALPDGSAWLVVGHELWRLDAQGRRTLQVGTAQAGLSAPPANLVPRPGSTEMYALPRGTRQVSVLDARTAQPVRRIELQWPPELASQIDGALWLAVHPDGRMAVANGGGHTVSLFDAQGRFVARTEQGTYRFTNELWWDGEDLWTTDTNGHALVLLRGDTLSVKQRVALPSDMAARFTALAVPHPRAGIERYAPMATLARMRNGMTVGRVTQVWPDGMERDQDLGPDAEPRSLAWLGETLVVVEGREMRLRRFDIDRKPMADFGDEAVRSRLRQMQQDHDRWRMHYVGWLALALISLLAGGLVEWRSQRRALAPQLQQAASHARFVGTPVVGQRVLWARRLLLFLPFAVLYLGLIMGRLGLAHAPRAWVEHPSAVQGLMLAMASFLTVCTAWAWWWMRRASGQDRFEPVFNAKPMQWLLHTPSWINEAQRGEHARETLLLHRPGHGRWLVLSNRRLLSFVVGSRERVLDQAWVRGDIASAQVLAGPQLRWWQRLMCAGKGVWVRIALHDGQVVEGMCLSALTAQRATSLMALAAPAGMAAHGGGGHGGGGHEATPSTAQRHLRQLGRRQALASALLPGLGQWWQGRRSSALLMFVCFAGWLALVSFPVGWQGWHRTTEIPLATRYIAGVTPFSLMLVAALDAWLFRARRTKGSPHPG